MPEYINYFKELTDLEGNIYGYVPEEADIWVADRVTLYYSNQLEPYLLFRVPKMFDLSGTKGPLFSDRQLLPSQVMWLNKRILKDAGWTKKSKNINMINSFVSLAVAKPDRILRFAKKWGPIWIRSNISIIPGEFDDNNGSLTFWAESIATWHFWAERVKTLLEIATILLEGNIVPEKLWAGYLNPTEKSVYYQRKYFALIINMELNLNAEFFKLNQYRGFRLWLDWSGDAPKLKLATEGLGFINSIWYLLAQVITQSNISICDGCSNIYARVGKKPARGRNNFCNKCSKGDKASKRISAQKKLKL